MNEADILDFELGMIRMCLMLNPENRNLNPEELDVLVAQEYKDSRD